MLLLLLDARNSVLQVYLTSLICRCVRDVYKLQNNNLITLTTVQVNLGAVRIGKSHVLIITILLI